MPEVQPEAEQRVSVKDRIKALQGGGEEEAATNDVAPPAPAPAPVATASYEGMGDAKLVITDKVATGSAKAKWLVGKLYHVTVAQKTALATDATFLKDMSTAVKAAGDNAEKVLRVLMALSCSPLNMFVYYNKAGGDKVAKIKQLIGWCELSDIKAILKTTEGKSLATRFSGEHPDNVLGEAFGTHYAKMKLLYKDTHPWLGPWYEKNTKFDLDTKYGELSTGEAEWTAGITGAPSTWLKVYQKSPRGKALNSVGQKALDKIVTFSNVTVDHMEWLFQLRFNATIGDEGGAALHNMPNYRKMYQSIQAMPIGQAVFELVTSFNIENKDKGNGDYADHASALGLGHSNIGGKGNDWEEYDATIRHELGHAVDSKVGGFEKFSHTSPGKWRRWMSGQIGSFAQHFADEAAGGHADMKSAAKAYLQGRISYSSLGRKLNREPLKSALTSSRADIRKALKIVLGEKDVHGAKAPVIGDRKFRCTWGSEYQSYETAGEDTAGISEYCYNSWAEFFAEIYTCWFAPDGKGGYCEDKTAHNYGGTLPGWVRSNGFEALVGQLDTGAMKGKKSRPKTP